MRGIKADGNANEVMLTLKALAYFYKTVNDYIVDTSFLTTEQKVQHCRLLVAEYCQFKGAEKHVNM